jgi:hypothetical protein
MEGTAENGLPMIEKIGAVDTVQVLLPKFTNTEFCAFATSMLQAKIKRDKTQWVEFFFIVSIFRA